MNTTKIILDILAGMESDGLIRKTIYQTPARTNLDLGEERHFPLAIFDCVTDWKIDIAKGLQREKASVLLSFVDIQPDEAFDGRKNEEKIDRCKNIAVTCLSRIMYDGRISIDEDAVTCRSIFDAHDTNVTGVSVQFTATEKTPSCL